MQSRPNGFGKAASEGCGDLGNSAASRRIFLSSFLLSFSLFPELSCEFYNFDGHKGQICATTIDLTYLYALEIACETLRSSIALLFLAPAPSPIDFHSRTMSGATARKVTNDLQGTFVLGSEPSQFIGGSRTGLSPSQKARLAAHEEAWRLSERIAIPSAREAKVTKDVLGTAGLIVEAPLPPPPAAVLAPAPEHREAPQQEQPLSPRVAEIRSKIAAAEQAARERADRAAAAADQSASSGGRVNLASAYLSGLTLADPKAMKADLHASHFTIAGPETAEQLGTARWQRKTELVVASPPQHYPSSRGSERAYRHLKATMQTAEMMMGGAGGANEDRRPSVSGSSSSSSSFSAAAAVNQAHLQAAAAYEASRHVAGSRKADLLKSHFSIGGY